MHPSALETDTLDVMLLTSASCLQIAQVEEGPAPTQSSEGLLNLLLLADSSLQYPSNDQNEQLEADGDQEAQGNKEHNDDSTTDDSEQSANDSEQDDDSGNETCSEGKDLDDQSAPSTSDDAARQRPTSAGIAQRLDITDRCSNRYHQSVTAACACS